MSRLLLRRSLYVVPILLLQWLIFGRLTLWGAYPDIVLLYLAWYALHHGRLAGATMGFFSGLALDALYGTWGIQALVKTLTGFILGMFPSPEEEIRIRPSQAFLGSLMLGFFHNGLLILLYALESGGHTRFLLLGLWLGSSLYTAFIGGLLPFLLRR